MIAIEVIAAEGHSLVRATHRSTFEITRDPWLTRRGDCIIGVNADKAARDLGDEFKSAAARADSRVLVIIKCGEATDVARAWGNPRLTFSDQRSIVVRRSSYVDGRTVAIVSDKAAVHLNRFLVDQLRRRAKFEAMLVAYTVSEESVALRAVANRFNLHALAP